jgi:predicted RNA binding protein YcfA (HicA-like mRNA interferase family)
VINALRRLGFRIDRQKGSHVILVNDRTGRRTVVPVHGELDRGTLRSILRQARVSVEELLKVLQVL